MGKLLQAASAVACMLGVVQSTGRSLRGVTPSSPTPAFTLGTNLHASDFEPYPGYAGNLVVTGTVHLSQLGSGADATQVMIFVLAGTDATCGTANVTGVANACGIHIHTGKDCSDASTIGGHFWNETAIVEDPWQSATYAAVTPQATEGVLEVTTGLTNAEVSDRVLVVHDATGARIACSPMTALMSVPAEPEEEPVEPEGDSNVSSSTSAGPHLSDGTQVPGAAPLLSGSAVLLITAVRLLLL